MGLAHGATARHVDSVLRRAETTVTELSCVTGIEHNEVAGVAYSTECVMKKLLKTIHRSMGAQRDALSADQIAACFGTKANKTLIPFPKLYEPLISHLNSILPLGEKHFRCESEHIQIFSDHDIVTDNSFGDIMTLCPGSKTVLFSLQNSII
jgi:hypothetical protein